MKVVLGKHLKQVFAEYQRPASIEWFEQQAIDGIRDAKYAMHPEKEKAWWEGFHQAIISLRKQGLLKEELKKVVK